MHSDQPEIDRARAQVRVLVLTGLGLNCEQETAHGFRLCGAQAELVHLADMLAGLKGKLTDFHILSMVGGFSFGDHLGGGVVYANRLRYRLFDQLLRFVADGGLILGICNGFQTMVKLGLLPALDGDYGTQKATLTANDRLGYRNAWFQADVAYQLILYLPREATSGKVGPEGTYETMAHFFAFTLSVIFGDDA